MNYKKFLRFVCGSALLIFIFSQLNTDLLTRIFLSINVLAFLIAVIFCGIANFLCALRWEILSEALGLKVSKKIFIMVYFESIAANCVLPGGILGGDIWRTSRLAKEKKSEISILGHNLKPSEHQFLKLSGFSVFLDRIHGFWSLCVVGTTSFLLFFLITPESSTRFSEQHANHLSQLSIYLIVLTFIMLLPILIKLSIYCFKTNLLKVKIFVGFSIQVAKNLWHASHNKKNIVISLSSQILFGLGFWICLYSIGLNLNIFLILVLVPGIFLFASFPVAIAGFGPREAGSLIFLMPLSLNSEHIFISSVLFGLTSTILGAITLLISLLNSSKSR